MLTIYMAHALIVKQKHQINPACCNLPVCQVYVNVRFIEGKGLEDCLSGSRVVSTLPCIWKFPLICPGPRIADASLGFSI